MMPSDAVQEEIARKFGKEPDFEKIRKKRNAEKYAQKKKNGSRKGRIKSAMKRSGLI